VLLLVQIHVLRLAQDYLLLVPSYLPILKLLLQELGRKLPPRPQLQLVYKPQRVEMVVVNLVLAVPLLLSCMMMQLMELLGNRIQDKTLGFSGRI
jgi:hypothetical protein